MKPKKALLLTLLFLSVDICQAVNAELDPYHTVQEALDNNRGRSFYLPAGNYEIQEALVLRGEGSGIHGHGRIIQRNHDADILRVEGASHGRVEGITLLRQNPRLGKTAAGLYAVDSPHLVIRDVKVLKNRAELNAVFIERCDYLTIEGCEVVDFKTIAVDDRMNNDLYRYAFNAINGHGIRVANSRAVRILKNRVIETELLPTRAIQEKYELGKIVDRAEQLGELASYGVLDDFVFIWHQGGGILVHPSTVSAFTLVDGNYIQNAAQGMDHIQNAAQGMDLHSDFLTVTNNQVTDCYMGMKAFHGARGVIIANNIFHSPGKYGILLRPGSESWEAGANHRGAVKSEANVQRSILIANNLITDQGYGSESWRLWKSDPSETAPVGIKVGTGPLENNPRLMDLIITGNRIYDKGRDGIVEDGHVTFPGPRYH